MTTRTTGRAAANSGGANRPADLVLVGGSAMTMDAVRSTAEAVAVRDGRIVAVGSEAEVRHLTGPRTRRVMLEGRTVMPAFGDAHVHPAIAGLALLRCPLDDLPRTLDAYLDAIDRYARASPGLEWVIGDGWYMSAFPGGTPSRRDLDRVVPDRPAFFPNRDKHGAWVNTRALELAGWTRDTPDPPDGRIEREPDGTPSGTIHEGAMERFKELLPPPTPDERVRALELAQAHLLGLGIAAWQDAWVDAEDFEAYLTLAGRGGLIGRATACHWWHREAGDEQIEAFVERRARGDGIGRLRANTVKIMVDGVAENFTAAMLEPYRGTDGRPTGNRGLSYIDPEALKDHVSRLDGLGFQVHFHALGDRAVREALDAVEAARVANGMTDTRPHLAHLQVVDPADVVRFRPLGAVANIQPYWACNDEQMTELTLPFLPPERAVLQYPFRSLRRAGAILAGGSDWSVSTANVCMEVETAVNRAYPEDRAAPPLLPEQALEPIDAFAAFTIGTAYVNHLDGVTGSIEPDKLADIVVLDRDVFDRGSGPIGDARVILTLVEGEAAYEAPGALVS
ncbi:MAG TPA: amidohydrolase [Candidatus Limnocylindrales bacterium]|nr:amidohydrolase [Candidatus Limnocylindrales bacterium]